MSIETEISALTAAVKALTAALTTRGPVVAQPVEPVGTKTVEVAPAPVVVVEAPAPTPVVTAAPVMPPPPMFVAPVEAYKPAVPFTDAKGMIQYVTEAYKAMGPTKGARIQEVITSIGVVNINEIVPDHYAALYAGVEALRNA